MNNMIERALWTAAQSFLTVLVAAGTDYIEVSTLKAAVIAAGAAALSALKTSVQEHRTKA